jgi:dimethylhistidine N-methyltransferase
VNHRQGNGHKAGTSRPRLRRRPATGRGSRGGKNSAETGRTQPALESGWRERFSILETRIHDSFAEAVRTGLGSRPRSLPPRFFYDTEGSRLFDLICDLPEYYVTRTEIAILRRHACEFPTADTVIEFGCGTGAKTRLLFDAFFRARERMTYIPVDISKTALLESAGMLLASYPELRVHAIQAEFDRAFDLIPHEPSLVLFLGSNIGNLGYEESVRFLSALRGHQVLVGFDMQKDHEVLRAAYDDAQGVTARFNRNVLARINRELGGTFDPAAWEHLAFYNLRETRIEMHLVSTRAQEVHIAALDRTFAFDTGERVHTEYSHKYSPDQIRRIARDGGLDVMRVWTDEKEWFSLVLLC